MLRQRGKSATGEWPSRTHAHDGPHNISYNLWARINCLLDCGRSCLGYPIPVYGCVSSHLAATSPSRLSLFLRLLVLAWCLLDRARERASDYRASVRANDGAGGRAIKRSSERQSNRPSGRAATRPTARPTERLRERTTEDDHDSCCSRSLGTSIISWLIFFF